MFYKFFKEHGKVLKCRILELDAQVNLEKTPTSPRKARVTSPTVGKAAPRKTVAIKLVAGKAVSPKKGS